MKNSSVVARGKEMEKKGKARKFWEWGNHSVSWLWCYLRVSVNLPKLTKLYAEKKKNFALYKPFNNPTVFQKLYSITYKSEAIYFYIK